MTPRTLATVLVAANLVTAPAQVLAHDPYGGWINPATGGSCCDDRDCQPARSYLGDDGFYYVFLTGRWRRVPPDRVLKIPSPDGSSHVCADALTDEIHCFVAGPPKS